MPLIAKPMLAANMDKAGEVAFPVGVTPKIDGIRALMVDSKLVSRALRPINNDKIRRTLEALLPDGADGEITVGPTYQTSQSAVNSKSVRPPSHSMDGWATFHFFDYVKDEPTKAYSERMADLRAYMEANADKFAARPLVTIRPLYPTMVADAQELAAYEAASLAEGNEGVMVRKPEGKYKFGRSTAKEGLLLKVKRFSDDEAVIVAAEELNRNTNEARINALGFTERSSHKENQVAGGTLGALVVQHQDGRKFKIGTGFNAVQRAEMWQQRDALVGRLVKYKFFEFGVKELPRHPVFQGFRSEDDLDADGSKKKKAKT